MVPDIDECIHGTHNCNTTFATCENTDGSFRCIYNDGFTENGYTCRDIDECKEGIQCNVPNNSVCKNTDGSFRCICPPGHKINMSECQG
ncbi:fibrillin-1-like [Paramuricea clavata]|uniref:Fibrillin-1-like, partial n=1 Tax=Paramuricea clavata TaxID=317549 RepID=A0A7D9HB40_PARCT|nr:fibrillin-1-like [Paramuricea clavata]